MYSGKEKPRDTENLFAQIFQRKQRIVEKVKQQVDLQDHHLLSKCLLARVPPPPWLWSPSLLSKTSEIISGHLLSHSRPSTVCPSSRPFSYQKPASVLADSVLRQDLKVVVDNPLEEKLPEEEQHDLSHSLVGQASNYSHRKDAKIASPREVQEEEEEGHPESVSICCRENQSCLSPNYSQKRRVESNLEATSAGCSQRKMFPKSVSTPGCEYKPPSPGYCQDETEPSTCFDPGFPIAKIQRSKSRQKALELRSSAKASKSRSNSRNELKPSPIGSIGHGIASLRSDSISKIKLLKHDEKDEGCQDEVEKGNSKGDDLSAKLDDLVDDPQSRSCCEATYLDVGTQSKSLSHDSSKRKRPQNRSYYETAYVDSDSRSKSWRKRQKPSNSISGDFPLGSSNPSHYADHEVDLPQTTTMTNKVSMVTDAETCIFQSETTTTSGSNAPGNRSKAEHSASVETSSIEVEPRGSGSVSLLRGGHVKESLNASTVGVDGGQVKETLNPSTDDGDSLVVEIVTPADQSEEKGECVATDRCSSAERVSQTGIPTDETTFAATIQESISKTDLLGSVESSSSELLLRDSVMQSEDGSLMLKPVTVEASLVEDGNNGDYIEMTSISNSKRLSQTNITVVEPVVAESTIQENSTPEDFIDHCKTCDISCEAKEVQPEGSLTNVGSSKCLGRISRPIDSAVEEETANDNKALSVGSDRKSADEQLEVRAENSSLTTSNLPVFVKPEISHFDDNKEHNINDIPMESVKKSTMEEGFTPASAPKAFNVLSVTDSEVNLSADNGMKDNGDRRGLNIEMVLETESHASHTGLKVRENGPLESNIDAVAKRPQHETFSVKSVSPISRNTACTEKSESHGPESSIREFFSSSFSVGSSQLQNKLRRTMDKFTSRVSLSSPEGDILESDSVREIVHHMEEATCNNIDHFDDELQKMIGSASADQYAVELQKMMGSATSDDIRSEECYLFKEAGLMSPALLSFTPEQLNAQKSQITPDDKDGSENTNFLSCAGETSHPLARCIVHDSDSSPVLEGFIISNDDENQTGSQNQKDHESFRLPRTSAERAAIVEQICKSARTITPSFHLAKTSKFAGKMDLDQPVSTELLDGMYFSHNLEGSSVFDNLGINYDYTRKSYTDCPLISDAGSSADAKKNLCTSPAEKLWYRKSSSSEKRASQTPDLPCISEENENINEAENLCTKTPKSMSSEKRGNSIQDLPCIAEENENIDENSEAVNEASDTERENVSDEREPPGNVSEDPMKFLPSISDAMIPVDRQSLDSVSTAFSFSAQCNSVKSKVRQQNGGKRRFTGKGKENQGGQVAGRNVKPPSSRVSKPKSSYNSSSTTVGPRVPDKESRYYNIVSYITSFVPLVQQQKPAAPLITGKRDVKVKALEAAEASKRIAEQKENDRKMKKEAMKLERARQEQENLRKQEIEKRKKEEDQKKKEAEMAWKQEMEKKKKEEERKRKEFEMTDRKRQREEEDKKSKEAKRQRIAEIQRQQREADQTLQAEKELKRQAKDARIKAQKELKEDQSNAEKKRGHENARIPEMRPKSNSSDDTNASRNSRDDGFKVISNRGKMFEESYDISPYKCSDNEEEDEEDDDLNNSNHKFVPTWASKDKVFLGVISKQNHDPDVIFSAGGFCDISKILLPRKLHLR